MVRDGQTGQPIGIITQADIAGAVADGKDVNSVRIYHLMTTRPTVIRTTTSVRDAAKVMTSGHFRHLPVAGDAGLVGIVDITDVCRALIDPDFSQQPSASLLKCGDASPSHELVDWSAAWCGRWIWRSRFRRYTSDGGSDSASSSGALIVTFDRISNRTASAVS